MLAKLDDQSTEAEVWGRKRRRIAAIETELLHLSHMAKRTFGGKDHRYTKCHAKINELLTEWEDLHGTKDSGNGFTGLDGPGPDPLGVGQ